MPEMREAREVTSGGAAQPAVRAGSGPGCGARLRGTGRDASEVRVALLSGPRGAHLLPKQDTIYGSPFARGPRSQVLQEPPPPPLDGCDSFRSGILERVSVLLTTREQEPGS